MKHPYSLLSILALGSLSLLACESTVTAPASPDALLAKGAAGPPTGAETCMIGTDVVVDAGTETEVSLSGLCATVEGAPGDAIKDRDRDGLIRKLNEASSKLAEGKTGDGIQKLTDFLAHVESLRDAAKPKIDAALADELIRQAEALIAELQPAG